MFVTAIEPEGPVGCVMRCVRAKSQFSALSSDDAALMGLHVCCSGKGSYHACRLRFPFQRGSNSTVLRNVQNFVL